MIKWLIILGVLMSGGLSAQQNFSFYENNDTLPAGITVSSTAKARQEIKGENKNQRRQIRKATREFYFDSNFALDNFLYNGRVIFNKQFNSYINAVADVLFKNEPLVRSKLKFYLIASSDVNAYTDHDGSVFITTGLMARINTEAQLAAVLGHEAVHYVLQHSLVAHIEEFKMDMGISKYANQLGNEILRKHSFSRLQETESDFYGFKTFCRTGYKVSAPTDVFRILKTASDPFYDGQFNGDLCKIGNEKLPKEWFTEEYIDPLTLPEPSDERSTHPALSKRIDTLRRVISGLKLDTLSGKDFLVSEKDFREIKKQSEFNLCNLYIQEADYASAFYHINVLLKKYPDDIYLQGEYARLFYVYAYSKKYPTQQAKAIYINETPYEEIDGRGVMKQVKYFLVGFKKAEVSLMALLVNCRAYTKNGKKENKDYLTDCLRLLVNDEDFDLSKAGLKYTGNKIEKDTLAVYDTNIVRKSFASAFANDLQSVFENEMVSSVYRKLLEKSKTNKISKTIGIDESEFKTQKKIYDSTFVNCGQNLIVLDPVFYSVDMRDEEDEKIDQANSEKKEIQLLGQVQRSARSFRDKGVLLYDWKSMKQDDIVKYDQLALLNEWYSDYSQSQVERPLSINEWKKEKLMDQTKSRYVAEFLFIGIKMRKTVLPFIVQFYRPLVLPMWLPDALVQMAKPREHMYMVVKIYDLQTNRLVYAETKAMINVRPHKSIIGGLIHSTVLKAFNGKLVKK